MTCSSQRIVLCPFGLPTGARLRESALAMLFACGGDLERVLDSPAGDVERYARHVSRIAALRQTQGKDGRPIVLLSRSSPIGGCVIEARKVLEGAIPSLKLAIWLLAVDLEQDPAFVATARRLAPLASEDLALAPIWVVPARGPFILFTTDLPRASLLELRIEQLLLLEAHLPPPQSVTRLATGASVADVAAAWKRSIPR